MNDKDVPSLFPPTNVELSETPITTHWLDEQGILCAISKKGQRTVEHYYTILELYKKLTPEGNKLCTIVDLHNAEPFDKEVRDLIILEFPKYIKASAIVTSAPSLTAATSSTVQFNFLNFPTRLFPDVESAKEWLSFYL
jgi:hypothetical protein